MATEINLSTAVAHAENTLNQSVQLAEDFDQFLQLLTVQMQNQDPLDPMDTKDMTNQIVQFSQAEQLINLNQKADSVVQMQLAGMSGMALSYVGMDASYVSSEAYFDGETPVEMAYSVAGEATSITINILNEEGNVVYTEDVDMDDSVNAFTWDGKNNGGETVEEGTYTVAVGALDIDGNAITTATVVTGRVKGVETQDGIAYLLIGERAVELGNVINAKMPNSTATETTTTTETSETETTTGTEESGT